MPTPATLPPSQQKALKEVQQALLRDVSAAAAQHGEFARREVSRALERLKKQKYNVAQVRREIKKIFARLDVELKAVLRLVDDAAKYAETYMARLERYSVEQATPLKPSQIAWAKSGLGGATARAAIAYTRGRTAGAPEVFTREGKLALSKKIHSLSKKELEQTTGLVIRAIREGQALAYAARELVDAAPDSLGRGGAAPRLIRDIRNRFKRLDKLTGGGLTNEKRRLRGYLSALEQGQRVDLRKLRDTEARVKDLEHLYKSAAADKPVQIRRYMKRLKGGLPDKELAQRLGVSRIKAGRMQGAWLRLAQDLERGRAAEKAIERWVYQKQRYRAETIMYSESVSAFRQKQAQFAADRPWIMGYRVAMTRGRHARFVAQKPGKLKKLGGAHCMCELYDGKTVTVQEYTEQWYRGFHPNCGCQFIEIVDKERMFSAPLQAHEKER